MYLAYKEKSTKPVLEQPGDIAVREVELQVPARRGGAHATFTGRAHLVVRLADSNEQLSEMNSIALFRRPGMVIDYWVKPDRKLGIGKRSYYALLICGDAVNPDVPAVEREQFDEYLRVAENPAHTAWERWDRLRDAYQQPYKAPLEGLADDVAKALRELVVSAPTGGDDAPQKLIEKFRIGSSTEFPSATLTMKQGRGWIAEDGRWHVEASVRFGDDPKEGWSAIVDLRFAEDGGAHGDGRLIGKSSIKTKGANDRLQDGVLVIDVPPGKKAPREVEFVVISDPSRHEFKEMLDLSSVELRARVGA
jgi:hypothetical protein